MNEYPRLALDELACMNDKARLEWAEKNIERLQGQVKTLQQFVEDQKNLNTGIVKELAKRRSELFANESD